MEGTVELLVFEVTEDKYNNFHKEGLWFLPL